MNKVTSIWKDGSYVQCYNMQDTQHNLYAKVNCVNTFQIALPSITLHSGCHCTSLYLHMPSVPGSSANPEEPSSADWTSGGKGRGVDGKILVRAKKNFFCGTIVPVTVGGGTAVMWPVAGAASLALTTLALGFQAPLLLYVRPSDAHITE